MLRVARPCARLSQLTQTSCIRSQEIFTLSRRAASSTSNLPTYPFPKVERPSPYQIFHLPLSASPEDVKNRYYELVRDFHPDAPLAREREPDAAVRHARFQAITTAYEKLKSDFERGMGASDGGLTDEEAQRERQRWQRPRPASYNSRSAFGERRSLDERWKDRLIWGGLGAVSRSTFVQCGRVNADRSRPFLSLGCNT
ncbi:hypothetical protein SCHPADRAFT_845190 [Schizopora paradoxa]|uniref:J domain-containing protein n=1 Tax=Schizopora paradoxa TaxID=27342 RepID=A0A0H2S9P9_9AGAM|nr:hypothetical protein SCHPADRAFT_845190 [Schizopora paradoxa]